MIFNIIVAVVLFSNIGSLLAEEDESGPMFVPGVPINTSSKKTLMSKNVQSYCDGTVTAHCADCKHLAICIGKYEVSFRRCDRFSPFCVENDVSADCSMDFDSEVDSCIPEVNKFVCTDVGYFPNPHYCHIFHICDGPSGNPVAYACPANYIYNAETKSCMKKTSTTECITVKCDKNIGSVWAQYGDSSEYYAFCPFNTVHQYGLDEIIMYKCETGFYFDGSRCSYKCSATGRFPDLNNNSRFYECFLEEGVLQYIVRDCPKGFMFNSRTSLCQMLGVQTNNGTVEDEEPMLINSYH